MVESVVIPQYKYDMSKGKKEGSEKWCEVKKKNNKVLY